jgi:hypothetical protein
MRQRVEQIEHEQRIVDKMLEHKQRIVDKMPAYPLKDKAQKLVTWHAKTLGIKTN